MASDQRNKFSTISFYFFGMLLGVIGYFLVDRDKEIKGAISDTKRQLWEQVGELRVSITQMDLNIERIKGDNVQKADSLRWLLEDAKDKEQRIRSVERACKP